MASIMDAITGMNTDEIEEENDFDFHPSQFHTSSDKEHESRPGTKDPATRKKNTKIPTNLTLNSKPNTVIIFKQINNTGALMTLNPVEIARGIGKLIPENEIDNCRINRRRNLFAVELKAENKELIKKLLTVTKLGKFSVIAYQPRQDTKGVYSTGVIGPIGLDVEIDALRHMLKAESEVIDVERLSKFSGGRKEESAVIKIDFRGKELPERVFFGSISYRTREYNPPTLRCYRCQRLGHLASGCTQKERCLICAGNHNKDNCPNEEIKKCANCGEAHRASDSSCRFIIQSKQIDKLVKTGLSFSEAAKKSKKPPFISSQNNFPPLPQRGGIQVHTVIPEVHNTQGSYIASQSVGNLRVERPTPRSSGSQDNSGDRIVTSRNEIRQACKEAVQEAMQEMSVRVSRFVKEAFTMKLHNESTKQKELLLINLTRRHFGKEISNNLLRDLHRDNSADTSQLASEAETMESCDEGEEDIGESQEGKSTKRGLDPSDKSNKRESKRRACKTKPSNGN